MQVEEVKGYYILFLPYGSGISKEKDVWTGLGQVIES